MRYLQKYETFTSKIIVGIDIDGTISNFGDAYNILYKRYFPDKFMFVSQHSMKQYSKFNIPSTLAEYPITSPEINKSQSIDKLEFDPEYLHILNVGLFNEFKNQGYVFEIAKKMIDYKRGLIYLMNRREYSHRSATFW